jgi:hypothetical protein
VAGGILAGFATDKHSSEPLVGGVVSTDAVRVSTVATPDDPALSDGFYWLFQPMTGQVQQISVKGAKSLYLSAKDEIVMRQGEITRYDVTLVSTLNHLGMVFNNLLALFWEFLQGLFAIVRGWILR